MKKLIVTTSIIALISSFQAFTQDYNFAIGVRSGGTSGLTLKSNMSNSSVEGIIGFWNDGLSFTGLYQRHPQAFGAEGFHWILGIGGHAAVYETDFRDSRGPAWYDDHPGIDDGAVGLGFDAMAGLEFKFPVVPLAISLDLKPYIEFTTNGDVWGSLDPGLGLKLAF